MDKLSVTKIRGSAERCGEIYGESFEHLIRGFFAQELVVNSHWQKRAKQCWNLTKKWAPRSAAFLKGMARSSELTVSELSLLSLHEEIYHSNFTDRRQQHCTAIAATGSETRNGNTIMGENWDWSPNLYPWAGVLKLSITGTPSVAAYHYPGLWNCCGVNSAGLSFMWTGGGYFPVVKPKVGVPTYIIISEIMSMKSVDEVLNYLQKVPNAGSFIFLLGDARKQIAAVEAIPGKLSIERSPDLQYRANLYCCPEIMKSSKQVKDPEPKKCHSVIRMKKLKGLVAKQQGPISVQSIKNILSAKSIFVDHGLKGMTIDRIVADSKQRVLWTRRGGKATSSSWQSTAL